MVVLQGLGFHYVVVELQMDFFVEETVECFIFLKSWEVELTAVVVYQGLENILDGGIALGQFLLKKLLLISTYSCNLLLISAVGDSPGGTAE